MEKQENKIITLIKKWSWQTYVFVFLFVVMIVLVFTGYLSSLVNNYLNDIYIHQATSLAESYATTIDLSNDAYRTIDELFKERLTIGIEGIANHLDDFLEDADSVSEYKERFRLDEFFIFDETGTMLAGTSEEYIGWTLPAEHPVNIFRESDQTIQFDQIRKASQSDRYYKYAYYKIDSKYLIQVGVLADNIYNFTDQFLPDTLSNLIENDKNILKADFYLIDEITQVLGNSESMEFDLFEKDAILSEEVEYRFVELDDEKVLQMFVPLYVDQNKIGNLILYHSTAYHTLLISKIMAFITMSIFSILLFIMALIYAQYKKSRDIKRISYFDKDAGILNQNSFNKYIKNNFKDLINQETHIAIILMNNYSQLKLIEDKDIKQISQEFINKTKENSKNRKEIFRFSEDIILLLYHDESIVNYFEENSKNTFSNSSFDENIDVKLGLLNIDEKYSNDKEIYSNLTAAILELRASNTKNLIIFTSEIWENLRRQELITNDLRRAYLYSQSDEFYVVFQPQINRHLNRVIGFEALSRWKHPKLGMIRPDEFIEAAEKSNLMIPLGDKIIEESLYFLKSLIEHGFDDINVSMNISYSQIIQPHFCEKFLHQIKSMDISPHLVGLEITESKVIEDYEKVNQRLSILREIGVRIYIDDFGKGYSNFERLQNLNADFLKIDHGLIKMIETDPTIVEAIFQITKKLDYDVVAEGVETIQQINFLEKQNCHFYQGFYYEKGLIKEDAIKYLQNNYHPDK